MWVEISARIALCRSRKELSNEYLLAKYGVDTAENEPLRDWLKIGQYLLLDAGTQYSITKRNLPYNSSTDLQKVCNILQDLVEIFCNLFWQTLKFSRIFQEFFKNFQRLFFKNSAAWWSLLVVANFQIHDWKFSDFSHFWEKKLLKFFDFKLSIMWGPLCKTIYHGGPKISEAPPGSPDEGGIWCMFANFSEFLEKFLQHFWARSAREDTNSEHLQSATAATSSAVSKKKTDRPLGEC